MKYLLFTATYTVVSLLPGAMVYAANHPNTDDAAGGSGVDPGKLENPLNSINSIPEFFQAILDIVMVLAIPFIVFFIIYAGFLYVMAQGKPDQIAKAHSALLYALIGGVLILAANVLLDIVTGTVNQFTSP